MMVNHLKETKMNNIAINIHSMVDLITNSSTELFILDVEKSVDVVKDILQEAINLHNKTHGTNYRFEDVFEEPYIGSIQDALEGWRDYYNHVRVKEGVILMGAGDNSIPFWMFDFIESVFGYSTKQFHLE